VSGKVQGVFYRASTREQALGLELVGYAKNLSDGRVEVWVSGSISAIDALEQWLWQGPPMAQVDAVLREAAPTQTYSGFHTA
jgi:acylphosphatase